MSQIDKASRAENRESFQYAEGAESTQVR
jgi:hypothetical protein